MALSREEWEQARQAKLSASSGPLSREDWERNKRMAALEQSKKNIESDAASYNPAVLPSGRGDFAAGMGRGLTNVWDRAGNLILPKALEKGSRYSSEAIAERKRLEEPLMNNAAGAAGNLVGEIAATLPVGMVGRAAVGGGKAALAASRGLQTLRAGSGAARVAGAGGAALEGAGTGLLTSDPGEGGSSALTGAALGGGMGYAGQVLGKTMRKLRPEITDQARRTMDATGAFIPVTQALPDDSLVRQITSGVTANIPGSQFRKQATTATEIAREKIFEAAMPHGAAPSSIFQGGVDDVYSAMKRMGAEWDDAFKEIKAQNVSGFRVPQNVEDMIKANNPMGDIKIPQFGKSMSVRDILQYQRGVQQLADETSGKALTKGLKSFYQQEANRVDRLLTNRLSRRVGSDGANLGEKYARNKAAWNTYSKLKTMATKKPGAEFTMRDAERVIAKSRNATPEMRDFTNDAQKALKPFPSNPGVFQVAASLGLLGIGGGGGWASSSEDASLQDKVQNTLTGAGTTLAGGYLAGRGASNKTLQKMMAQYGEQGILDKFAPALRRVGSGLRSGVIAEEEERY